MRCRDSQAGAALVTVMMIVALASVAVVDIVAQQQLDIRRTRSREALAQARYVALGAERWAASVLYQDRKDTEVDSLDEPWATVLPPLPIEGGQVAGLLEDLQGRFNLNNLLTNDGKVSALDVERFQRLLLALELETDLALAVQDWIDADFDTTSPGGAEDDYYSTLERPYRAANRPFASVRELRLVRGVVADVYAVLAPHVSALPERTAINVNTATEIVLRSLGEHIDEFSAAQLAALREEEPFENVQAFTGNALHGDKEVPEAGLSVSSGYFRASGEVDFGPVHLRMLSFLKRGANGAITVYRRARGAD